jgi:NADH-quinone oxidoreductase subunit H
MISFLLYKLILGDFAITLFIAASTYAERKVAAFMQDRIGPDRAVLMGIPAPCRWTKVYHEGGVHPGNFE